MTAAEVSLNVYLCSKWTVDEAFLTQEPTPLFKKKKTLVEKTEDSSQERWNTQVSHSNQSS